MEMTPMQIRFRVSVEAHYVRLDCEGMISLAELRKLYTAAVSAALEHQRAWVLLDVRNVRGTLTTMERFESSQFFVNQIFERALGVIQRFAVCGHEPLIDPGRFGEIVARNRGVVDVKAHTNLAETIAWLQR